MHPSAWLVVGLVLAAISCGAVGVHLALRALAAGWLPLVRKLAGFGVGGVTSVSLVPPMGSGDVLMYAAYGRVAALGDSPYVTAPADISRLSNDSVTTAVELPWQGTTSVYGPVATWLQEAASRLSGESTHTTVMWLQLTSDTMSAPCVVSGPAATLPQMGTASKHGRHAPRNERVIT